VDNVAVAEEGAASWWNEAVIVIVVVVTVYRWWRWWLLDWRRCVVEERSSSHRPVQVMQMAIDEMHTRPFLNKSQGRKGKEMLEHQNSDRSKTANTSSAMTKRPVITFPCTQ